MHTSIIKEIRTSASGRTGLVILLFFLVVSILTPFVRQKAVTQTETILQRPSLRHLFGTNDVGQDIFSRLVLGTATSLIVAVGVTVSAAMISLMIGVSAGFKGGWYEQVIMRITDVFLVIPGFVLLILISSFIRPGIFTLIFMLAGLRWPAGARIIRAQTKSLKEKTHVKASRSFGAGNIHIFFRHILPDLGPLLVVLIVQYARTAVFMEAGLAFIGIADPTMVSWGTILHHAFKFYHLDVWWWLFPAAILLSLYILSLTLLGYSLEKVIEPRLRHA